nr:uncharacterized protein LOC129165449 [Nothobranchius furzeri]
MEKSQWDLKRIRFDGKRLTRLDDFVLIYQRKHDGLLREYGDVVNKRRKSYRVETEKWKKISRKRKGFYVTPQMGKQVKQDYLQEPPDSDVPTEQTEAVTTQSTEDIQGWDLPNNSRKVQEAEKGKTLDKLQVTALWKREETEVVVAVIPSQIKGNNFIVHHSELQSLEPHQWLTGEIIECALHVMACKLDLGSKIYILNHYTAGVILFGKREMMRRHCLSKVNFDNYEAIVSFVNVGNVHWKCLPCVFIYTSHDLLSPMLRVVPASHRAELVHFVFEFRTVVCLPSGIIAVVKFNICFRDCILGTLPACTWP